MTVRIAGKDKLQAMISRRVLPGIEFVLLAVVSTACAGSRDAHRSGSPEETCDWREMAPRGYKEEFSLRSIFSRPETWALDGGWSELVASSECPHDAQGGCRIQVGSGAVVLESNGRYTLTDGAGGVDERGFVDGEGRRTGEWQRLSRGRVEIQAEFRGGRLHGTWTRWDRLYREVVRGKFENGEPSGVWEWKVLDGDQVTMRGQYVGGVPDGTWQIWSPDGTELGSFTLDRGTGDALNWYPDGRLQRVERAVGGRMVAHTWYEERGAWHVLAIKDGQPNGPWARFDEGGMLIESGFRKGGALVGIHTFYEDGVPVRSVCERGDGAGHEDVVGGP